MLIEGVSASVDQQLTMGFCANSATSSPGALDLLFVEYASNGSIDQWNNGPMRTGQQVLVGTKTAPLLLIESSLITSWGP